MSSGNEVWTDIPGYEGLYQVSTKGRVMRTFVKGVRIDRLLKLEKCFKGKMGARGSQHYRVYLSKPGSKMVQLSVQKVMYQSFFGPVPDGMYVVLRYPDKGLCLENLMLSHVQYTLNHLELRRCTNGHALLSTEDYYKSIFKRTGEKRCKICHRAMVKDQRKRGVIK